ncbi:MAG: hypothetical protein PUK39_05950 [Clostridiales bacterium]|nr:hypothetical protein [Clostridiales bacterium]
MFFVLLLLRFGAFLFLGQHRTIRQADSARDFSSSQGLKSAGLAEKIRRSAQAQLRGVALDGSAEGNVPAAGNFFTPSAGR